jgi:acyl carrier protein
LNFSEVLAQVNEVFIDVLDDPNIRLVAATTAKDIDDWDSLTHIELVVAIEKKFAIKFSLVEVQGFKNVGAMCEAIESKTHGR